MGFPRVGETDGEVRYELEVPAIPMITATHVLNINDTSTVTL